MVHIPKSGTSWQYGKQAQWQCFEISIRQHNVTSQLKHYLIMTLTLFPTCFKLMNVIPRLEVRILKGGCFGTDFSQ